MLVRIIRPKKIFTIRLILFPRPSGQDKKSNDYSVIMVTFPKLGWRVQLQDNKSLATEESLAIRINWVPDNPEPAVSLSVTASPNALKSGAVILLVRKFIIKPKNIIILQKKMRITEASFLTSSVDPKNCPAPNKPEYAFIGRSNVGKSSLLNMLCNRRKLAKISGTPGKTRLINHFLINNSWYMVDLPGYGYAKLSKTEREKFKKMIDQYLTERPNLANLFVLIDSRHAPIQSDLEFMQSIGSKGIPFAIVFTKTDKLKPEQLEVNISNYKDKLYEEWEELPPLFFTSATTRQGQEEVLAYIEEINKSQG